MDFLRCRVCVWLNFGEGMRVAWEEDEGVGEGGGDGEWDDAVGEGDGGVEGGGVLWDFGNRDILVVVVWLCGVVDKG